MSCNSTQLAWACNDLMYIDLHLVAIWYDTQKANLISITYNYSLNFSKFPIISLPVTTVVLHNVGKSSVELNVSA